MTAPLLVRIVVAAMVLPWFVLLARRVRDARDFTFLAAAFYLIVASDVANVFEQALGIGFMDGLQHAMYAAAGVASAIGILMVRRGVVRRRVEG